MEKETDKGSLLNQYNNAEECLLGIFIQDEESAAYIAQSGLVEGHFLKVKNRILFPILLGIRIAKGTINFDMVADECQKKSMPDGTSVLNFIGGFKTLSRMIEAPIATDIATTDGYIDIVYNIYRVNTVNKIGHKLSSVTDFVADKIIDILAEMQTIVMDNALSGDGLIELNPLVTSAFDRFIDRNNNPEMFEGFNTGFYFMTKYKVIAKKKLTIIGARTSVGKSNIAMQIMINMLLDGANTLVFSPELDRDEIIDRALCTGANVPIDEWKDGTITESEMKKIHAFEKKILSCDASLYIEDRGTQTVSYIISSIKRHMLNHTVDVVFIDYLQTLSYEGDNTKKAMTQIVNSLFAFAKDNNIAIILISQLRRSREEFPELSDLKESGDIENVADSVILLHRESITGTEERKKGYYKIAKNRKGQVTDPVELAFDSFTLKISEVDVGSYYDEEDIKINGEE